MIWWDSFEKLTAAVESIIIQAGCNAYSSLCDDSLIRDKFANTYPRATPIPAPYCQKEERNETPQSSSSLRILNNIKIKYNLIFYRLTYMSILKAEQRRCLTACLTHHQLTCSSTLQHFNYFSFVIFLHVSFPLSSSSVYSLPNVHYTSSGSDLRTGEN